MTILATTLIASSLVGCFGGGKEETKVDLSSLRQQCSELSGFTGNAQFSTEVVFVWRADDAAVAECEWNDGDVKFIILGTGHPGDNPSWRRSSMTTQPQVSGAARFTLVGKVRWQWETREQPLAFYNEYRDVQMITARGKHPEGLSGADDCAFHDTGSIVVYDFAPDPIILNRTTGVTDTMNVYDDRPSHW